MKWYEFQAAICIAGDLSQDIDNTSVDFKSRRWCETPKDLCGSLVEYHLDQTVSFVHPTARE